MVAIASRNLEHAKETASLLGIETAYGSYEELLNDPTIDAIYNPLPNNMHIEWSIKAMQAGKHVLCEKPIGISSGEALKLQQEAQKYPQLKVMEAFMYRFHPQWLTVKSKISRWRYWRNKSSTVVFFPISILTQRISGTTLKVAGGALMDIGCYCVSFPRFPL